MGKKNRGGGGKSEHHAPVTLREEATGKLQIKGRTQVKDILKVEHLKKLAAWAGREAQIPSLGAFYGHQLAAVAEATGGSHDPSLITCQRCETVLHPGFNCTVRIEKNRSKVRRKHNKSVNNTQNNVVYKCHYCLHQNVKRGTPKGHIKELCPPRNNSSFVDGPSTPSCVSTTISLEGKKRRRNSSTSKMAVGTASMPAKGEASKTQSTASKRRKKSWTSLKELAQSKEHETSHFAKLSIPFLL